MAGSILTQYGGNNTAINCSIASLANGAAASADYVDNSSNNYQDALVQVVVKTGGSSVASTGVVNVYAVATANNSNFSEGTGVNSVIALTSPPNARLVSIINAVANGTTYTSPVIAVTQAFGGVLPERWAIIVENKSGGPLDSTESNHKKYYEGVTTRYT